MSADTDPHDLALTSAGDATCSCGTTFEGRATVAVRAWETHVETVHLLNEARVNVENERAARAAGEAAIRSLLARGVASRTIAEAIGRDDDGNLHVSPTLVLRLGREEHVKTPRRRRRA